jgi:arginine deiminase
MNKAGISVIEIELDEFVKTYGAPHCATQVTCRAL